MDVDGGEWTCEHFCTRSSMQCINGWEEVDDG